MKLLKSIRLKRLAGVFIFVFAVIATQFSGVQFASALTTDTWTGTAGDGKFSTATNWQGGVAPVNGDVLAFDVTSLTANSTVNNDMTNLSLAGINFSGTNSSNAAYTITGNAITLTGSVVNAATTTSGGSTYYMYNTIQANIVLAAAVALQNVNYGSSASQTIDTASYALSISASSCSELPQLVGSGSLNLSGSNASFALQQPSPSFSGAINISSGVVYAQAGALGDASGATNISGTGSLNLYASADSSWSEPFNLGGSGYILAEHGSSNGCMGSSAATAYTATLTGPVTLQSDFAYGAANASFGSDNLKITGTYTNNSHSFNVAAGVPGTLTLPTGTVQAPVTTNKYSDSQPAVDIVVGHNDTTTLDGERGRVDVADGGILMGDGTAASAYITNGGIIAPGHSPGKLTITQTLYLGAGSIYQAQLQTATVGGYDQIQVSDPSRTTGNDVYIDPTAVLDVSLYPGYNIKKGDQFMIINNLQPSTQKVTGTFANLSEGTQFTVGGITFGISYVGGDGNDVVLTALSAGAAPVIPNTGAKPLKLANPIVLVGLGIMAAGILLTLARRRFNN